jgi:hypothetical protein
MNEETKQIQELPQPEEELAVEQTEAARGGQSEFYVAPSKPVIIAAAQCPTDQFKK